MALTCIGGPLVTLSRHAENTPTLSFIESSAGMCTGLYTFRIGHIPAELSRFLIIIVLGVTHSTSYHMTGLGLHAQRGDWVPPRGAGLRASGGGKPRRIHAAERLLLARAPQQAERVPPGLQH